MYYFLLLICLINQNVFSKSWDVIKYCENDFKNIPIDYKDMNCILKYKCQANSQSSIFLSVVCDDSKDYYYMGDTSVTNEKVLSISFQNGVLLYTKVILVNGRFKSSEVIEGVLNKKDDPVISKTLRSSLKGYFLFDEEGKLAFYNLSNCTPHALKLFKRCFLKSKSE